MNEVFCEAWETDELSFRYTNEKSRAANGKEFHAHHELIFFIDGNADLITERYSVKLLPHTLIVVPKNTFHQLIVQERSKSKYLRCVFQFQSVSNLDSLIQEKCNALQIVHSDELTKTVLRYKEFVSAPFTDDEKDAVLHAFFTLLLVHIREQDSPTLPVDAFHPITEKAIAFINENLLSIQGVTTLASALGVSPSYLAHLFKSDMQIPLYQYIRNKKLLLAHEKIKAGAQTADAALECGFNDYSGFFRQYKKTFGFPPSKSTAKSRK